MLCKGKSGASMQLPWLLQEGQAKLIEFLNIRMDIIT